MVGCKLFIKKKREDWLTSLLNCKFFDSCIIHQQLRKNEKNVFCMDCNLEFCRHCVKAHFLHPKLQICKYVYQDVVRLQDIQKHLDCSKIQTYKINGEKAVHLNPRPQSKDSKPSTKAKFGASCEACGRYLQDVPNRFCSIACKVSAESVKATDEQKVIDFSIEELQKDSWEENFNQERQSSENESTLSLTDMSEETQGWMTTALKPRKRLHKRKGIPRRSPLC
ncbi:protein RGF1 INDUCIBLE TRANSCRIPTION FACTOR 1 [Euphorbia lathyris]|uniref:protein RGF1 INDUCIBLE TRANSCRIPTION FACTOR 1 n=1 Tax=Euphorbia lathyris TaxID=212925 RepID=UPI00331393C2